MKLLGPHDDHHKARLPVGALAAIAALPEVEWVGVSARGAEAELGADRASRPRGQGGRHRSRRRRSRSSSISSRAMTAGPSGGSWRPPAPRSASTTPTSTSIAPSPPGRSSTDRRARLRAVHRADRPGLRRARPEHAARRRRSHPPGQHLYGLTRFSGAPIPVGIIDSGAEMGPTVTTNCHSSAAAAGTSRTRPRRRSSTDRARHARPGHDRRHGHTTSATGAWPPAWDARSGSIRVAKVWRRNKSRGTGTSVGQRHGLDGPPGRCDNQPAPLVINYQRRVTTGTSLTGTDVLSRKVDYQIWINRQLYVVCSGNEGRRARTIRTPGVAKNALTVGSVVRLRISAGRGHRAPQQPRTHRGRPHEAERRGPRHVITSAKAGTTDEYKDGSGCSMATPHVTGLAATLMHHYPSSSSTRRWSAPT